MYLQTNHGYWLPVQVSHLPLNINSTKTYVATYVRLISKDVQSSID